VAGATLLCDRYVSILTGPVVGLVTGDTARILLEVDRTAEITCHVCLVDESCPQGREVQRVKMVLVARRPQCFALLRLLSGERYVCSFAEWRGRTRKFSALSVDGSPLPAPDATTQVFLPDRLWAMLEKGIDLHSETRHRHCVCVSCLFSQRRGLKVRTRR